MTARKTTRGRKNPKPARKVAAKVEYWPIEELPPYARNARTHSAEQIREIAASIREFGFAGSVLADGKGIAAGHGRVEALKLLHEAGEKVRLVGGGLIPRDHAPVTDCAGWSEAQRRAFIIADNRIAEKAGWDQKLLALEFADLGELGFNMDILGFDAGDRRAMIARAAQGLTSPDDAPQPPARPTTKPGDLLILGEHRLVCGDSTDPAAVERLLQGEKPNLMVTDPPYGVEYDAKWRASRGLSDDCADGAVLNDHQADWRAAWELFPGKVAYVWYASLQGVIVAQSLVASGFNLRSQIVWVKPRPVISRGHYHWGHEPCLYASRSLDDDWQEHFAPQHEIAAYAVKDGESAQWEGDRKQSTVWQIEHVRSDTGHSTQKPVECMRRPILNNSKGGDAVYEPFSGSGTTFIAAEMEGRRCFGLELNPAYCDVIVKRWEAFTGQKAERVRERRTRRRAA